jgi:hypothetical protein
VYIRGLFIAGKLDKYLKESIHMAIQTTIQTVNLGQYANDGSGDDLRTAFEKVNSNIESLKLFIDDSQVDYRII